MIVLIPHGFAPFRSGFLSGNFNRKVLEPCVLRSSVPVLYLGWYVHYVSGMKLAGLFAVFLIPSASRYANQHLTAAVFRVMNVPVVAAGRLKRYVVYRNLRGRHRREIALSDKILGESVVLFSYRKYGKIFRSFAFVLSVDFLDERERAPCLRPTAVERELSNDFNDFGLCYAVLLAYREMTFELRIKS